MKTGAWKTAAEHQRFLSEAMPDLHFLVMVVVNNKDWKTPERFSALVGKPGERHVQVYWGLDVKPDPARIRSCYQILLADAERKAKLDAEELAEDRRLAGASSP